jgi:hypothetical protein
MPRTITVLRILVASPSDLSEERKLLEGVVQELNLTWPQQLGVTLELIKWETHAFPSAGTDPQDVINEQLPQDYDILIVMLWSRIGTPTPRSQSGTVEEFEIAYDRWRKDPKSIRLMVYFKVTPISPDDIDPDQLRLLQEFRKSLSDRGILYSTFTGGEEFTQLLRIHVSKQVQDFMKENNTAGMPLPAPVETTMTPAPLEEGDDGTLEDEGFLDLIETTTTASQKAMDVMQHITKALEELNAGTNQSTHDMQSISGDDNAKVAAYKRIANRQAENMADFVARMQPELPILGDSLSKSLDAYGRTMVLLPEFGMTPDNRARLEDALTTADTLRNVMSTSKEGTERFRSITAGLPRITTQFNRAKRDILNVLDTLLTTYDRGLNLLGEIEIIGKSVLESWQDEEPSASNEVENEN